MRPAKASALLAIPFLLGCTSPAVEGRYLGTVTPTQPGPLCKQTPASLQIRDGGVVFAPDEGTWLLEGSVAPGGDILAAKSRVGPNKEFYETVLEAKRAGNRIDGTYKTPRCISTVALTRR